MIAHQAVIRKAKARETRRPRLTTLAGCTVEPVSLTEARVLIEAFEYLGTMNNRPRAVYGLRSPTGELLGVASFGSPMGNLGVGAIALERGACVPWAPKDAASYLISRAVKLAHAEHAWHTFAAYADPEAGEMGTIYQALNWRYVGQGVGHSGARIVWKKPGTDRWVDERHLRRSGFRGKGASDRARAAGWESSTLPAKHKFCTFVGPDARTLEAAMLERLGLEAWPKAPRRPSHNRARTRRRQKTRRGATCAVCSVTLSATRSHARTCSIKCRVRAHRTGSESVTGLKPFEQFTRSASSSSAPSVRTTVAGTPLSTTASSKSLGGEHEHTTARQPRT